MAPLRSLEIVGWLNWMVMVGGLVICLMNARISRHMGWVVAGLAAYIGMGAFYILSPFLQRSGLLEADSLHGVFWLASLGSLVAHGVFFGGLAAVFRDLRDQMRVLAHMADSESPRSSSI